MSSISQTKWTGLLFAVIALGWLFIIKDSGEYTQVRPNQTGCYKGSLNFENVTLQITRNGMLTFHNVAVPIHVTSDKEGLSFETKQRVILIEEKRTLKIVNGYPDLFRINRDGTFYLPTNKRNLVLFVRCK